MAQTFHRPIDPGAMSPNRRKSMLRRVARLLGNLTLLGLVAGGVVWGWASVRSDSRFDIREITIEGPERIDERATGIVEAVRGSNLFTIDLGELRDELEAIDWIREVEIEKRIPGSLEVVIRERIPVATVLRKGREVWVDEDGNAFPVWPQYELKDLPRVDTPTLATTREALSFMASLERRDPELFALVRRVTPIGHRQWMIEDGRLGTRLICHESDVIEKWRTLYGIAVEEGWSSGGIEYADLRFDRQLVISRTNGETEGAL